MPIIHFTMEARKLLYTVMLAAPVALMTGIGIHARTYSDTFEWPYSVEDHKRISAYIPYLVEVSERSWKGSTDGEARARYLANILVDGERSGRLEPLVPITADELDPHGHKADVYERATTVARFLIYKADGHILAGKYPEATANLVLASDSLSALKYSEFTSLLRCTLQQGNVLTRFKKIYRVADDKSREEMKACMARMKGDRKQFAKIAKNARKVILECFGRKQTVEQAVQSASSLVPESSVFEQPALAKERPEMQTVVDPSIQVPNQRVEARQCILADERNRAMIHEIMTPLPKPTL